ncbi:Helix-turn-helix type 11 domain protein [Methanococcus vannielii SB]|uniref:Helix-turn-helix type 11 domain protein n=1 Tax=Methanococcus vannielii (strain ATCC 35089 / DSM 1224 / JCM 13029 / OCM 148 / SB) TaxID=406327 RepID=A6UP73_METVS|nr:Rrf2 family transcriptional regulator [Methanococcus vannielii]ABR54295.1 Helix-turn-helix type 11 domain protein [Methanococcus vannielii SB]
MKIDGITEQILTILEKYTTTKEIAMELKTHPKNIDRYIRVLRDLGFVDTKKGKTGGVFLTNEGKYVLKKKNINLITIKVQVVANDKIGLLASISSKISEINGNILSTTLEKEGNKVVIWLVIENLEFNDLKENLEGIAEKVVLV